MVIYYEFFLLINIIIHVTIILSISNILNIKIRRIYIGIILDIIYLIIYTKIYIYKLITYLIGFIISYFSFNSKKIYASILYFIFNYLLGGIYIIIYAYNHNYIMVLIISLFILMIFIKIIGYKNELKKFDKLLYDIMIIHNKKVYMLKGYLDTGCDITDEFNIPVIILNKVIGDAVKKIKINTVNRISFINLYKVDSFYIKIDTWVKRDIYISVSNINYDALLNINLFL